MSQFAEKIKNLREERKLSAKKVAEDVGIPWSRLRDLEWGVRVPTTGQTAQLEKYYELKEGELGGLATK